MRKQKHNPADYNTDSFPTWCPGCGDWSVWASIKASLAELDMDPAETVIIYGIGCSGNMANTVRTYGFHGLHGRAIPVAAGVKLANHRLNVIVVAGDGDCYGEGLNHFIHASRANHDITVIILNNQIYGLTTGQTSPTSHRGYKSKSTPQGVIEQQLNPLALAIESGASHVARGFAGDIQYLTGLMKQAIEHKGFSVLDIFQPCVTFNRTNTYQWFRQRLVKLERVRHKKGDRIQALKQLQKSDKLPIGVLYSKDHPVYHEEIANLTGKPLVEQSMHDRDIETLIKRYV